MDSKMADNPHVNIVSSPAAYKSKVWKTFGFLKDDNKTVVCRLCETTLKYTGSTTNMSTHLRRHHKSMSDTSDSLQVQSQPAAVPRQQQLKTFLNTRGPLSVSQKAEINRLITKLIVDDLRPFRVVECSGFVNLVKLLEPRYVMPSRQYFSERMFPCLYEEVKSHVLQEIQSAEYVALTTDGWTSRATQSYITITAQYIDPEWRMKNFVLQTRLMNDNHTGLNIATVLMNAVNEWGLTQKCPALVSDNASNMIVAARETKMTPFIRCFAHTLNLMAQRGLKHPAVALLLARVRRIVVFFHRSTVAASILSEKRKLLSLPDHKLKVDVCTRWNSAYDMLERFLEQQPAVFAALVSTKDLRKTEKDLVSLSETDVTNAEDVIKVMQQLKVATTALCTEQGPTLSLICPLLCKLMKSLEHEEDESTLVRGLKNLMKSDLEKRYVNDMELLRIITALDPRFKDLPFVHIEQKMEVFSKISTMICRADEETVHEDDSPRRTSLTTISTPLSAVPSTSQSSDSSSPSLLSGTTVNVSPEHPPSPKKSALTELLGDIFVDKTNINTEQSFVDIVTKEIISYQTEECLELNGDSLLWWKEHKMLYPNIARLAKRYLGIPATSVPSERVFSTAGDIVTASRSILKPKNVDMMVFLKKNS